MKIVNRVLGTVIAMLVILLIAIGVDRGIRYYDKVKYEQSCQELYAVNYAKADQLRSRIEEISQNQEELEGFIQDYEWVEDEEEDVLRAFETASFEETEGEVLKDQDLLGEHENLEEEDFISGNGISGNGVSEEIVSGNGISGNGMSAETVSGNAMSGNGISEETVSGNAISGNEAALGGQRWINTTLAERRQKSSSYIHTLQVAKEDQKLLEGYQMNFADVKIACLGDSITEAANLSDKDDYQQYAYPTYLAQFLGAKEVVNLGIGGSSIGRYWQDAFVERYREIPKDTDLILVMGGTNDGFCLRAENVGNFEQRLPRTLIGDLDELMRGLKENYPDAEIVFITPLPNVLHDMLRAERPELLSQRVVVDTIIRLALEYQFDVIDLYNSNFLDSHDAAVISNYVPDGVHCNPEGYQLLAQHLAADLVRLQEPDAADVDQSDSDLIRLVGNGMDNAEQGVSSDG